MTKRYLAANQTGVNAASADVAIADAVAIEVKNARKITAQFIRAGHSSGNGVYSLHGSIDGVNYSALPLTAFVANTNAQTLLRALSVTLSANGNALHTVEEIFAGIIYIKPVFDVTTDGTGTILLTIEDELTS